MGIKSKLTKATMLTLAAGTLAVGGLGAGPASADSGWDNPPQETTPAPIAQYAPADTSAWWRHWSGQQYPYAIVANNIAMNRLQAFQAAWPYFGQYYSSYNLSHYVNAGTVTIDTAEEAAIIAAASDVLGLPAQNVVTMLSQGQSLTQIAASRGINRGDFVNALNNAIQSRIGAAISAGAITPAAGITLLASLSAQVNNSVDQAGYPVAQATALNVWHQIFS